MVVFPTRCGTIPANRGALFDLDHLSTLWITERIARWRCGDVGEQRELAAHRNVLGGESEEVLYLSKSVRRGRETSKTLLRIFCHNVRPHTERWTRKILHGHDARLPARGDGVHFVVERGSKSSQKSKKKITQYACSIHCVYSTGLLQVRHNQRNEKIAASSTSRRVVQVMRTQQAFQEENQRFESAIGFDLLSDPSHCFETVRRA